MSDKVLICGSVAFDTIAVFEGHFKDHILADNIQSLSVSFFVPTMRKEYGGCAGNIAYNLQLLGGSPVPVGTVGSDAADYIVYMQQLGIDTSMVRVLADMYTPQCFITTDLDNNQIASFHPGAMTRSAENDITGHNAAWAIVAPDAKEGMFAHARRLHAQGIPFVFDLGQAMPLFSGDDINEMLQLAQIFTANDYEASVVEQRTGRKMADIAQGMRAIVVTQGAAGAILYTEGSQTHIPPVAATEVVDPTGCGDAHRAGLLYGLTQNWGLADACRLANVMGSFKIASRGPQNHRPTRAEIGLALNHHYGVDLLA
ncbi:carbohydrate kinase family protein [Pollutimonas thiosulfatoxidans]|uniref:Carbohydrate kinase family protein n=1 Tax=Pollutimonas thiosulfatoxidans TaxID=2028345 RepID=A0A410GDA1_9BURK|nr:carbohydrate kinase family protein [Pollutimonas thiosulfatoxidans]MBF6615323.1 carbohydrate kinase family protein [Candidimonas sp.]NYT44019.1 carbohydrate kinase family protein [Alcaligenaceae bacterium]QAA94277.1 carbohydrate kinase family protein [Pollutimonas thiosulfatoxidans]